MFLGFYSKAYEFSRYSRRVVATPIISVFFPTFAAIQDDRLKLSRAFFRATSLMIRAGAFFSLLIVLLAPEIFTLFLPDVWQPMLLTFQLMMVYTLLDPITLAPHRLLLATGRYIGEGFDDARLDTLFLALPVSWKGTLVQYAGRLHRLHPGKREVRVIDYVDSKVPMLVKMFEKRRVGYRAIGYREDDNRML